MIDKLSIIKQILETDEATDKKILSVLQLAKEKTKNRILLEDRMSERKSIVIEADLNSGKERIYGETENLSPAGAFIRTNKTIARGEDIAIRLINPGGEELGFIAKVVRVNTQGIGVMIKTISKKNRVKLAMFIEQV